MAEELLNVYDDEARIVGQKPRGVAKASGQAVGAVNLLLVSREGRVLLQRRPPGKENGGRWDKSVGGHVSAGEQWDQTMVRECGEELFDDAEDPRVRLARSPRDYQRLASSLDLGQCVLMHRVGLQKNLRDIRHTPGGSLRNVVYHLAIYLGRTDLPLRAFRPQPSEIDALRWFTPRAIDRLLVDGQLPPNMAFLWLTHALPLQRLLAGAVPR